MTERHQALILGNAGIILFAGLIAGFGFLFELIGEIRIWPIPGSIEIDLPSDPDRWRAAHTGNIMNALMAIGVALSLPHVRLSAGAEKFVTWGMILAIWGNFGFYFGSALGATGRGLTFHASRLGGGDWFSKLTFLVGYPGAFILPVVILVFAIAAFRAARSS